MYKRSPFLFITAFLVSAALFIGCAPNLTSPQERSTVESVPTSSATQTFTPTAEPSETPTFTLTPEPTATETSTITPSPTPNMVMPGIFGGGGCRTASMSQGGQLEFCVTGVTVNSNRHMIFNVTWTLSGIPSGYTVTKRSDQGNGNMYLIDNFGNRYTHIGGGGAAYSSVDVADGVTVSGWFEFSAPPVGAFVFDFHDNDNGIVIGGISLYGGASFQTLNYKEFSLEHYPLLLRYVEEAWQPSIAPDGSIVLASKSMPTCTIWSFPTREPQGEHKSTIAVGAITYAIYGYFDSSNGFYVREYIYQGGLAGIDPNLKPFFFVTIPADNTLACIYDVSDVLSSLAPKTP